jgi:hypothetical protein
MPSGRSASATAARVLLALSVAAIACVITPANASERGRAPWCANLSGHGLDDCNYYTYRQCLVNVHGLGGACSLNPRAVHLDSAPARRRHRRVYR